MSEKYEKEFNYLEELRQSGATNMFGATPFLQHAFGYDKDTARKILQEWMNRYEELCDLYGWDN